MYHMGIAVSVVILRKSKYPASIYVNHIGIAESTNVFENSSYI